MTRPGRRNLTISPSGSGLYPFQSNAATIYTIAKYQSHALIRAETLQGKCGLSCHLAQKIHKNEDAEALFCYKHVVQSVFAERRKASACPTITQHSVCCFPRYSPSPW